MLNISDKTKAVLLLFDFVCILAIAASITPWECEAFIFDRARASRLSCVYEIADFGAGSITEFNRSAANGESLL